MGRSRYRRRHVPTRHREQPETPLTPMERLFRWGSAAVVVALILWFADVRSGLLRAFGSPLPALLIDAGVVAVVAIVLAIRRMRR